MGRPLACLGDKTTYGQVVSATAIWCEGDKPIVQSGDLAHCEKCNGTFPIIGTAFEWSEKQPYAATGDRVACRCPDHVVYGSTRMISTSLPPGNVAGSQSANFRETPAAANMAPGPGGASESTVALHDRVFARSCLGTTKSTCTQEPIENFGRVAVIGPTARENAAGTALGGVAIGRVAGSGLLEGLGTWAVRGASSFASAASPLLLALWPSDLADGTLYTEEQLRQMSEALTRVRFQFRRDAQGVVQIHGFHTFSHYGGEDRVAVRQANWNADKSAIEARLGGLTITWTPNSGPLVTAPTTYPGARPDVLDNILVHPIPTGRSSQITTYPGHDAEDITWQDVILTFPADSGVPPLYLVFAKPAVEVLEVDTYGAFTGRPRNGLHVDHMPSQAALKLYLQRTAQLDDEEIKVLMKSVACIAIPAKVHQKFSETYGWRNTKHKQITDSKSLRDALDSNFEAIKPYLLEENLTESSLEEARSRMHHINQKQGWYP
ncbi:S-type pyocin domain-containing protein [Pseudomonas sp. zfem002]|uniref:S-type pyocin domain-containing protein n=1 Tax=Pseudomonas sp. zfem002 TaxID=3078197 RepID=UPI0029295498|nr:S-type pyocin domain-containing protein [Pseudomonas sp. zfem002]MDU9389248.1 S-type pyocin domain-containing protein [Pseudomonas sp. zfem002]